MDGRAALLDTNILIDFTRGIPSASAEMARYGRCAISVVTWMEVLAGERAEREAIVRKFLARFQLIRLSDAIAEQAVLIRRDRKLKLPDSIILATAITENLTLVTRNTRDFMESEGIRIPYRI